MRRHLTLSLSLTALLLAGCAGVPHKAADPARQAVTAKVLRQAFESGRALGAADDGFVPRLEEASLSWLLLRGPAPEAGTRRLLDLRERQPLDPLIPIFMDSAGAPDLANAQQTDAWRDSTYFNSYDAALYRPFFRNALLAYLASSPPDDGSFLAAVEDLALAARLTPRFAGVYPNQLGAETRLALQSRVDARPQGAASERFRMLLDLDARCGAWADERARLEGRLSALARDSKDELLRLELADALNAPHAKPERAFWMSLLLPGLGQASNGDLEGGLLLGGLTAAAWAWAGSRLAQAGQLDGPAQSAAYGDAGLGAGLAILGHAFTALNAGEQARLLNVVVTWDVLSKDRLRQPAAASAAADEP